MKSLVFITNNTDDQNHTRICLKKFRRNGLLLFCSPICFSQIMRNSSKEQGSEYFRKRTKMKPLLLSSIVRHHWSKEKQYKKTAVLNWKKLPSKTNLPIHSVSTNFQKRFNSLSSFPIFLSSPCQIFDLPTLPVPPFSSQIFDLTCLSESKIRLSNLRFDMGRESKMWEPKAGNELSVPSQRGSQIPFPNQRFGRGGAGQIFDLTRADRKFDNPSLPKSKILPNRRFGNGSIFDCPAPLKSGTGTKGGEKRRRRFENQRDGTGRGREKSKSQRGFKIEDLGCRKRNPTEGRGQMKNRIGNQISRFQTRKNAKIKASKLHSLKNPFIIAKQSIYQSKQHHRNSACILQTLSNPIFPIRQTFHIHKGFQFFIASQLENLAMQYNYEQWFKLKSKKKESISKTKNFHSISKLSIQFHFLKMKNILQKKGSFPLPVFIARLNREIRYWSHFYSHLKLAFTCNSQDFTLFYKYSEELTFKKLRQDLHHLLWKWAKKKHNHQSNFWIFNRYWYFNTKARRWNFSLPKKEFKREYCLLKYRFIYFISVKAYQISLNRIKRYDA